MIVEPSFRPVAIEVGASFSSLRLVYLAGPDANDREALDPDALIDQGRAMSCNPVRDPSDPDWGDTDLSSIRCVAIGATNVPPEIMQPWFDRNIPTQQLYGLTEGVPVLAAPWEHARRKSRSAGTSVLYCQARVVDEHLERLPSGEPGEIVLRGRSLFKEYWRPPEATQQAFAGGWFRTGDVGVTDAEGYFYVVDRIKNIVIVGSSNVYPADLERVLLQCDAIAEAAVVGRPDPDTGEALVACVVLKAGKATTADEIRGLFLGRLAEYQHPKFVLFLDSLPHTSLGKVQKAELRKLVEIEMARHPGPNGSDMSTR